MNPLKLETVSVSIRAIIIANGNGLMAEFIGFLVVRRGGKMLEVGGWYVIMNYFGKKCNLTPNLLTSSLS